MKDIEEYRIMAIVHGFTGSYLLYTACELGIFDYIGNKQLTYKQLSQKVKANEKILYRLLRPLVSYGLIYKNDEFYSLTKTGIRLVEDSDNSLKGYVLFCGRECMRAWAKMYEATNTDKSPYDLVEKKSIFEIQDKDVDKFRDFNYMMGYVSKNVDLSIYLNSKWDENSEIVIVDVGGGTGEILIKFLKYFKNGRGITIDLPHVRGKAEKNMKENQLCNKWYFKEGNFFHKLNVKGDIFVLSRILHDWEDREALSILKNLVVAMKSNSVLVVIEKVLTDTMERGDLNGYMNDLQMWALCNGKERSELEFRGLFKKAGLKWVNKYYRSEMNECIIELQKDILNEVVIGEI